MIESCPVCRSPIVKWSMARAVRESDRDVASIKPRRLRPGFFVALVESRARAKTKRAVSLSGTARCRDLADRLKPARGLTSSS